MVETDGEDSILRLASCEEFTFRKLQQTDFDIGFPNVLEELTEVGAVTRDQFEKTFQSFTDLGVQRVIVILDK